MSGEQGTDPGGRPSRRLRVAGVFDGRGSAGPIVVDRPPVDPDEFEPLVWYLTKAPVALATTKTGEDELAPGAGLAVPRAYHTDGEWVWPAAVGYYLHRYRLPPQPALLEHIRSRNFSVGAVDEELRQAAARQMLEELAAVKRAAAAAAAPAPAAPVLPAERTLWMPAPGPEIPEEPAAGRSGEVVYSVDAFSRAFTAVGNRHAAWVYEQIETFIDHVPVDEWSVDHATGRYTQAGRVFTVDALGRLAPGGRWFWAWAEAGSWSVNPALTECSRLLRDEGDRLGIRELTEPVLDLARTVDADDPEVAAEMLAWACMGVTGARGYIGHTFAGVGRGYYLVFDESIPVAEPDIDGAARFLSHGTAKFDEDAADCVVGYVEHHGWDWSRSAHGIVVSAGGLGTFTAVLSANGVLTGIALHD